MAQRGPPRTGLTHKASIADLVKDLELLGVDTKYYGETMDSMVRALDLRIEELKTNNGTLLEGYNKIVKDLEQTHNQQHALKDCYSKIKEVLSNTQGISLQEEADFLNRAEKCNKDLENKKFTVLVAGETSAGKSSLINLLLNEQVLPTGLLENTRTICEISYGAKQEAVIHFAREGTPSLTLANIKSDTLKQYIEKPTSHRDWCKKIEIKIPNSLLKGGVVIVDSPGIGDSEKVCNIALEFLPQAFAFIYVINSPNAGGTQDDRLMRIVREWKKLYVGDKCTGLTSESALFVCNKWDDVEKQTKTNPLAKKKIKYEIICKLKKEIPKLKQKSQVIEMSVFTAAQIQQKFGVMSDDLSSLISGLHRLLPLCLEKKTEHFYRMTSGCLKSLSDQVKVKLNKAKHNQEERRKVQQDVEKKLDKLRQGSFITETDKALSMHLNDISQQVRSYLLQDDVKSAFCTWEKKDLPQIDDIQRANVKKLKEIYNQCLEQRLEKFLQTLKKRDGLFVKAHEDLEERFRQEFFEFEKDVRDIDLVLIGESTDEAFRSPLDARVKKFIFLTSVVFMPVLFPIGLAAGVLSAPVIGYFAVDRILNERHLRNDSCQVLKELSTHFLQRNIDQVIFDRVSQEFTEERERIDSIKRCYKELLEKYEKKCKDLTKSEDEKTRKRKIKILIPLNIKLEDMSQNLTFDAIQYGIRVMSPSCEIDKSILSYKGKLGSGSFGEVYKGEINRSGREGKEVAVKKLKDTSQASNVASFVKEAEILMQVNHINIVAFYGVVIDVQNNQLCSLALVFELCEANLENHIFQNRKNVPWETKSAAVLTCQWGIDILDALDYIHGKRIVHRDLKLANVLINKHEQIRLGDLGLATFKTRITGTYTGRERYMAPEISREQKIYDSKVDMYSFGLMMWEMWFGEIVPSKPFCRSQDEVTRQIEVKKQGREGRPYPPPATWVELMVSLWDYDPCVRKTAIESQKLMKKIKQFVKEGTQAESQGVLTEDSEKDAEVHEQAAKLSSVEGTMGARYHGGSKGEVEETSNDKAETEGNEEGEKTIEVEPAVIATSRGTSWASKEWAVHLILPADAVSERTSIVVHRWEYNVRSPPLQEHEAITSNVIELSSTNGQKLTFNSKVRLSLSHSATGLKGYELVIKKLIDKETNNWEDVDGTRDIRCPQDVEDNHPSHMKIQDVFFPVAQADISECSTYTVVCRLKASPTYSITSGGGSFSHPDFPGVEVTIPNNSVAPDAKFPFELQVQEVPNAEFEGEGMFLGPVLRIKCIESVQFSKPATIQLPISLGEQQDFNLNPTTCHVRVLFLKSHDEKKEWIEITDDLVKAPTIDGKFVRFHVERLSAYSHSVESRKKKSRSNKQRIINHHNNRISVQPRLTVFFAYFRPDRLRILCLMCCPAHLKAKVLMELEKRGKRPVYQKSNKDLTPGHDKASVSVSGGICPHIEKDMEEIYLRLLEHDPDDAELEVCFRNVEEVARVEFYSIINAGSAPPLCRLHLGTPTQGTDRSDFCELTGQPSTVKKGSPTDDELEHLSTKISDGWRTLGRRLSFQKAQLKEFDNSHEQISEKAYAMLLAWKQKYGSDATYIVLSQALCHTLVNRRGLAEEFCCY